MDKIFSTAKYTGSTQILANSNIKFKGYINAGICWLDFLMNLYLCASLHSVSAAFCFYYVMFDEVIFIILSGQFY